MCIYVHTSWKQLEKVSAQLFSHVWLFVDFWTVAHQAPLYEILQARILEWVATSFSIEKLTYYLLI